MGNSPAPFYRPVGGPDPLSALNPIKGAANATNSLAGSMGLGAAGTRPKYASGGQPVAPVDWGRASASDVARSAIQNLGPSAKRDLTGALVALSPVNWAKDVGAVQKLLIGAGSKFTPARYFETPAVRAKNEAALNAVTDAYRRRYMTGPGFKQAVATDPFGVAMDASSLAAVPAGLEGIAARLPGKVGDVARATTTAARTVRQTASPIGLAGQVVAAPAKALRRAVQGPVFDASGNLSGAAQGAVATAFPNGIIGPEEMARPAFKATLADTMSRKGISPEAAREAVLRLHGAPTPRSLVTGKAAPEAASATADNLAQQTRAAIRGQAQDLAGAPGPSPTDLGSALERAQIAAHNDYRALYKRAFSHPGTFDPAMVDGLPDRISAALDKYNLPNTLDGFSRYPSYEQAPQALSWLSDHMAELADSGTLTMGKLERARQELGAFWRKADGPDSKAVQALIEGFDQNVEDAARQGMFSGSDRVTSDRGRRAAGVNIAADMRAAREGFKDYTNTFLNTSNDTHSTVTRAVRNLIPDQPLDADSGLITGTAPYDSAAKAQAGVAAKLINPRTLAAPAGAEKLFGKLSDTMGGPGSEGHQALSDLIRQTVLATDDSGNLLADSGKIQGFLRSPLATQVFDPDEASRLRLLGAANEVANARLARTPPASNIAGHALRTTLGGAGGYLLGAHAGIPAELGAIAGGFAEQPIELLRAARLRSAEAAGAPETMKAARAVESIGEAAGSPSVPAVVATAKARDTEDRAEEAAQEAARNAGESDWSQYLQHPAAHPAPTPEGPDAAPAVVTEPETDWSAYLAQPEPSPEGDGGRIERKAGGRVDDRMEALVQRLLKAHERARKTVKTASAPILRTPDDHVARALSIAAASLGQ